jgi:hypothetical protein
VVVDHLTFFAGQRAALDAEVVDLVVAQECLLLAIGADPAVRGDLLHPRLVVVLHELAADVVSADELAVIVELRDARLEGGLEGRVVGLFTGL